MILPELGKLNPTQKLQWIYSVLDHGNGKDIAKMLNHIQKFRNKIKNHK